MPRPLVLHRLVHIEAGNLTEESLNINIGPGGEMSFKETGATQLVPPGLTGFGSTMRGGIKSLLFSMPYLQKQRSREEGVWGGYHLDNLIITTFRKRLLQRRYVVQHQNLKEFRPD